MDNCYSLANSLVKPVVVSELYLPNMHPVTIKEPSCDAMITMENSSLNLTFIQLLSVSSIILFYACIFYHSVQLL